MPDARSKAQARTARWEARLKAAPTPEEEFATAHRYLMNVLANVSSARQRAKLLRHYADEFATAARDVTRSEYGGEGG
ncbi:hypothetical protein ACIBKY_51540 [Nonomuraea sp. NPDC050394]|uniref:hypothetical protein n=1 Tax=Nonomuraea sp. NPDC050394 TaxID=3364363 RepID=UPI0037945E83